jgi:20S proteasome alpha/beta subunit
MTLVVGLVCQDAIIIASDSRTSDLASGRIRDDAQKISLLQLTKGVEALIAQAGHADLAARAVEILERIAKDKPLNDYRAVSDLAEQALKELRKRLLDQFHGSPEDFKKHLEEQDFELMIAHYYKSEPHIFTVQLAGSGLAIRRKRAKVCIGCGAPLADFLLNSFAVSEMPISEAFTTAIYAVEEVKKHDMRCGGETQAGSSFFVPDPRKIVTQLADDEMVQSIVSEIASFEKTLQEDHKLKMRAIVEQAAKKWHAKKEKVAGVDLR